jgi:uncharacterized membrane protein
MVILVVILLVLWLVGAVVGFAIKGLLWVGVVAIILFCGTALISMLRRRTSSARRRDKAGDTVLDPSTPTD